jgi:hypothetical protein
MDYYLAFLQQENLDEILKIINKQPEQETIGGSRSPHTIISYEVKIELQLYPGKTIPADKLNELKCNAKYNSILRNYARITGDKYKPYSSSYTMSTKERNEYNYLKQKEQERRNKYLRTRHVRFSGGKRKTKKRKSKT